MRLPVAVTDTSVLINLDHLHLIDYLSHLFKKILVPAVVREEFFKKKETIKSLSDFDSFTSEGFFEACESYDIVQVKLYNTYNLDAGESHALSQFNVRNADMLLIDDDAGRKVAQRERCKIQGTARILAEFEKLGFISMDESVQQLITDLDYQITDRIISRAKKEAGIT